MPKAFTIIFQDDYFLVVNKIAKVLVEADSAKEKYTLTSLLEAELKFKVYPCHRLDRETTGLIIYAKNKQLQELMMDQFRQRLVAKHYFAFVRGCLEPKNGVLKGNVLDKEGLKFGQKPKLAITNYKVIKEYNGFSLLDLNPLTGRTNQLRIQLAQIKHPILGERKYAFGRDFSINTKRLALHAYALKFTHPILKKTLDLEIPLAQDLQKFLDK